MSVWNGSYESDPAGTASPRLGDDKIRELKGDTRLRLAKEHTMYTKSGTGQEAEDGWHSLGSAKIYFGSSAPTLRPDNATSLDSTDSGRLWYDSSTEKTYIWNGSAWKLYGATASGGVTTGVNFLNGGFETDLSNWVTYDDGANVKPVDGTGGTPTAITVSRSLASPMFGTASMVIAKSASNAQGQGVANVFTIDAGVIGSEFDCFVYLSTDTNYVASDMGIYLYDVTNAAIVPMTVETIPVTNATSKFRCRGNFTNSLNYRLCFHIKTTNALSYNVKIDQISFDTDLSVYGASGSQEFNYTPTLTNAGTSPTIQRAGYSVNREFYEGSIKLTLGTALPASELRVGLPSDLLSASDYSTLEVCGQVARSTSIAEPIHALIEPSKGYITFGRQYLSGGGLTKLNANNFSASEVLSITFKVKMAHLIGKGVVQLAESSGPLYLSNTESTINTNGVVGKSYYGIDGAPILSNTSITYYDITLPRALMPNEVAKVEVRSISTGAWIPIEVALYMHNGTQGIVPLSGMNSTNLVSTGVGIGDSGNSAIMRVLFQAFAGTITSLGSQTWAQYATKYDRWRVRISPNNAVELPPTVHAHYTGTSSGTPNQFNTLVEDTHNAVTTGIGWKFTAPMDGLYEIIFLGRNGTTGAISWNVRKNAGAGGTFFVGNTNEASGADSYNTCHIKLRLKKGEYVDTTGSINVNCYIQITRLGN